MSHDALDNLDARLADLASVAGGPPNLHDRVLGEAREIRWRRRFAGALSVVVLAGGGYAAVDATAGLHREVAAPATSAGVWLGWPARGSLAGSPAILPAAMAAWDSSTGTAGGHTDGRLLFAQDTSYGRVVVIEARDAQGRPRLAILTGAAGQPNASGSEPRLWLRLDRNAPVAAATDVIGFVTARVGAGQGRSDTDGRPLVFLLAAPGVSQLGFTSTAIDQQLGSGPDQPFRYEALPVGADAVNTAAVVTVDGRRRTVPLSDNTAVGDPGLVATTITVSGTAGRLSAGSLNGLQIGDLVVTPAGLAGQVTTVTDTTAAVRLVTDPATRLPGRTAISNYTGTLTGTGSGLHMTGLIAPARMINEGNRVLVDLGDDAAPVTAGRVASADSSHSSAPIETVRVTPTVDVAQLRSVFVMLTHPPGG